MSDLRIPIGLFFSAVGVILLIAALAFDFRAPLTSINVNLYCGVCMLVFGGLMLWLARRAS